MAGVGKVSRHAAAGIGSSLDLERPRKGQEIAAGMLQAPEMVLPVVPGVIQEVAHDPHPAPGGEAFACCHVSAFTELEAEVDLT